MRIYRNGEGVQNWGGTLVTIQVFTISSEFFSPLHECRNQEGDIQSKDSPFAKKRLLRQMCGNRGFVSQLKTLDFLECETGERSGFFSRVPATVLDHESRFRE